MPKKTDPKELLRKQIKELEESLDKNHEHLGYYEELVCEEEKSLMQLKTALSALEGTLPSSAAPSVVAIPETGRFDIGGPPNVFPAPQAEQPKTVKVNGEDVVLEPGFHVERNSFGEDCIVPDGVTHAPAAEPAARPDTSIRFAPQPAVPLPALTSGTGFEQSPEELIFDELPIKGRE